MKSKSHEVFTLIAVCAGASRLFACGPDFPNTLLSGGDAAVLAGPAARFSLELQRMKLENARFPAVIGTNDYPVETVEAEITDLQSALRKAKVAAPDRDKILEDYRAARESLQKQARELHASNDEANSAGGDATPAPKPPHQWKAIEIPAGLPDEFADYFRGCIAYYRDDTNEARTIWAELLKRPAAERHYRSTWAAYMLGRLCGPAEADQAVTNYAQVRALAGQGFADTLGLAAASLGWEAQADLRLKKFEPAVEYYLQQYAAGDYSAENSLRFAARQALAQDAPALETLAKNPRTQRVITATMIADNYHRHSWYDSDAGHTDQDVAKHWLDAVEAAGVRDVASAEELALAAYQNDQMETAQRWIDRSRSSPVSQWLQAKLLLRDGKVDRAAALLAQVSREFPILPPSTNETAPTSLQDTLFMDYSAYYPAQRDAPCQVLAELGVLRLARHDYEESLDALLRSGYWLDAAYVAERVLTVDELKAYVDREWPAKSKEQDPADPTSPATLDYRNRVPTSPEVQREDIRYLLARRLTRVSRGVQARSYYSEEHLGSYDALMTQLNAGRNESLSKEARAAGLYESAKILKTNGMELIGTEAGPDWHVYGGYSDWELSAGQRATNAEAKVLVAGPDELRRYDEHRADPEVRFHYRYQAAGIAMEAAKLLPNNSELTAQILYTAGCWLKNRDPETADLFYKSLVRRCRKTALGEAADRKRWFPDLDEQGNPIMPPPRKPKQAEVPPPQEMNETPPVMNDGVVPDVPIEPVPEPVPETPQ